MADEPTNDALRRRNAFYEATKRYRSLPAHMKRQGQQLPIAMLFRGASKQSVPTPSTHSAEEDEFS